MKGKKTIVSSEEQKLLLSFGILEKWHNSTLDDFTNDDEALHRIRKYLVNAKEAYSDGVGYCLYGDNGVGKTLLLNASFKELIAKKYRVRIISVSSLISKFTDTWYNSDARVEFIQMLQQASFLGIEEIGKQMKTEKSMEMITHVLDTVIRYRVQRKRPIWITTNVAPKDMRSLYSDDIASMLNECCVPLHITGKDMRTEIRKINSEKY